MFDAIIAFFSCHSQVCSPGSLRESPIMHSSRCYCSPAHTLLHGSEYTDVERLGDMSHGTSRQHHKLRLRHTKLRRTSPNPATLPPDHTHNVLNLSTSLSNGVSDHRTTSPFTQSMYCQPSHIWSQNKLYNNSAAHPAPRKLPTGLTRLEDEGQWRTRLDEHRQWMKDRERI